MSLPPYYDRNGVTLYCGDCLDVMGDMDAEMPVKMWTPPELEPTTEAW